MVSYIPVLTTLFSIFFLSRIVPHYLAKRSPYLLWWTLGVLTFGAGTLTESINAIFGWSEWNTKVWYIVGALLGGYPLAQGTIYLLMKRRFADASAIVCTAVIIVAAICVLLSPIEIPAGFDHSPDRTRVRVAMGQRLFSPAQPLCFCFPVWRCRLFCRSVFRIGECEIPVPRKHSHRHWRAASGHRRKLHAFRLC